jgi:hypothetical protein
MDANNLLRAGMSTGLREMDVKTGCNCVALVLFLPKAGQ